MFFRFPACDGYRWGHVTGQMYRKCAFFHETLPRCISVSIHCFTSGGTILLLLVSSIFYCLARSEDFALVRGVGCNMCGFINRGFLSYINLRTLCDIALDPLCCLSFPFLFVYSFVCPDSFVLLDLPSNRYRLIVYS